MPCSTLSDLTREMEANVPVLTRQKKEGEFLRQKAEQYQKLVTSMKVRCVPRLFITASVDKG